MAREVAKVMTARTSGSIINVSSVFALGATRQFPVISYYAAKGGVEGLTKGLAVELGSSNVRVNSIAPGFFPSPMSAGMFSEDESGAALRRDVLLPRTALPSLPQGKDLRGAVRYLASDESAFVTGDDAGRRRRLARHLGRLCFPHIEPPGECLMLRSPSATRSHAQVRRNRAEAKAGFDAGRRHEVSTAWFPPYPRFREQRRGEYLEDADGTLHRAGRR